MADIYSRDAKHFFEQYQQLRFEDVHASWLRHLPEKPGFALDVGAGSGRDAVALAERGWEVLAVEPATGLRELAESASSGCSVQWGDDQLPELGHIRSLGRRFQLILVSAVWMHLPTHKRPSAFKTLAELLAPAGIIIITLRHGPDDDERVFHETNRDELENLADTQSLTSLSVPEETQTDQIGRREVSWQTVVFQKL